MQQCGALLLPALVAAATAAGPGPGGWQIGVPSEHGLDAAQVRKTPNWPRSWANCSWSSYICT